MSTATPSDVRSVIATDLSDGDIQTKLDEAEYRNQQANNTDQMDTQQIRYVEQYLAALLIRETLDRAIATADRQSASVEYEGMSTAALRRSVREYDPSGELGAAVLRDSDRHVTSTAEVENG